jgi:hypothetical protein
MIYSCEQVKIIGSGDAGRVRFTLTAMPATKAVIRALPDTNNFILKVQKNGGQVVYSGKYGLKPSEFTLQPGTYDVEVYSSEFNAPAFDTPVYRDSRTIIVESGVISSIALIARQSNSGVKMSFSGNFKTRFADYETEISDSKGKKRYPYTEERYLYLTPGNVNFVLINRSDVSDTVRLMTKSIESNVMLFLNMDVLSESPSGVQPGITVDTLSSWITSDYIYGEEKEGDGLTPETALLVGQIASYTGSAGVWIAGYIIGGDLSSSSVKFVPPFTSETNLAMAASATENDRSKCASVSLPSGSIRSALNLVANPGNIGRRVCIKGTIVSSYFGLTGINPVTDYRLE